jgi:hypothetical protein
LGGLFFDGGLIDRESPEGFCNSIRENNLGKMRPWQRLRNEETDAYVNWIAL